MHFCINKMQIQWILAWAPGRYTCWMSTTEEGARVRFPPPLVFLGTLALGVSCRWLIAPTPVPTAVRVAGALAVALGVGLIISARVLFVRTHQSPIPWKPTPELIFGGPYRFTRNPMYVGATVIEIGLGAALPILWISLLAPLALLCVHFIAVRPEERYLSEKFGAPYTQYLERVRRYL
jgi:protein-S-isoprenylcysteine O-methyltransferase Ste14